MRGAITVLWLASLTGCYEPTIADRQYSCRGSNASCPDGFHCDACLFCVRPGHETDPSQCPPAECTQGRRVAGDPSLMSVAFCPAVWRVPGVVSNASLATPCSRGPGPNGTGMAGGMNVDCTVEDNCGFGWHVCRNDAELAQKGLSAAACSNGPSGFFATRQPGDDSRSCVPVGVANVMGCGSVGSSAVACAIIARALTQSDCAGDPSWACGAPGTEGLNVTRVARDAPGGVLCCQDP